jgi:hypothetical protein
MGAGASALQARCGGTTRAATRLQPAQRLRRSPAAEVQQPGCGAAAGAARAGAARAGQHLQHPRVQPFARRVHHHHLGARQPRGRVLLRCRRVVGHLGAGAQVCRCAGAGLCCRRPLLPSHPDREAAAPCTEVPKPAAAPRPQPLPQPHRALQPLQPRERALERLLALRVDLHAAQRAQPPRRREVQPAAAAGRSRTGGDASPRFGPAREARPRARSTLPACTRRNERPCCCRAASRASSAAPTR